MKKIALIGATGKDWWDDEKKLDFVRASTPVGYEIINFVPRYGTHSVESATDEAYNAPYILEQVVKAIKQKVDAIVIDCVCDPILDAAREISEIPVIGPRNASLHLALVLGTKFSIITVQGESLMRCMEHGVRKEGLEPFCMSIRYLDISVLDISKNPRLAQKKLLEVARSVIEDDGANVIILGCTALSHEIDTEAIMEELGVPILDPFIVAIRTAVAVVDSGLSHSKAAYPNPPDKPVTRPSSFDETFDDFFRE